MKFHLWSFGTYAHKQRFCPMCLREKPYRKDIWELSLLVICPIHNCLMIDRCGGCGAKINPYRQSLLSCKCGFDYRQSMIIKEESFFAQISFWKIPPKNKIHSTENIMW
ncbi:TniQ family protein [Paenibacillus ehimensis]|uniref:TniQ family protein n=1 Tax=Paenibacillus ehimensis TaxID=79264 RepID=UPI003898E9FF